MTPEDRLIVALDTPDLDTALALARRLAGVVRRVKIGLELFTAVGPESVRVLRDEGFEVMLDLKLHDIPETVARAVGRAANLGAELLTVHTAGGRRMLEAAVAAASGRIKLLGVTVLTSFDVSDLRDDGCGEGVHEMVLRRSRMAQAAGLAGVVSSPEEAAAIRAQVAGDFLIVTPGIRASAGGDDQKRVATARAARAAGADLIVVGRPVRDALDPRAAALALIAELAT